MHGRRVERIMSAATEAEKRKALSINYKSDTV